MKIFTLLLLIGMLLPSAIGFWWLDLEPRKQLSVDNHTLDSGSDHQSGGDQHSDQQNSKASSRDPHYSHHQHGGDHMKGDDRHSHHHGSHHMKGDDRHSHHHGSHHMKGDDRHSHQMKGDDHHSRHNASHHIKGDDHHSHHHHGSHRMNGDDRHSHHHMNGYDRHSHHHMNGDDRHSHHHMNGDDRHSHHHINGDDRHSHHHMNGDDRHSHHHMNGDDRHSHHKSGDRVPSSDKHHSHHHGSDRNCSDHQHSQQHDGAAASGAAEPHTPAAVDPLTAAAEPHIPALELVHNTSDTLPCPMLYTRVGQRCLAFFTVARVPWSTAREFCNSIFGDLVTFTDIHQYIEILEYLQTSGVDVDLWVGGRDGKNGWEWMDGTPMPRGTPYWAIRSAEGTHSHIHPSTSYLQAPYSFPAWKYDQTGSCAAMMPKYFYYLSDVACRDLKSPVCALREGAQVVIARGSEDTYPGIFIPTQDDHTIVWEKAPPTKTAHTTTDMEGAPPNTTAHTNTATTQQVTSTPPASTSSPISKPEDDSDGSGIQPFPSKHRTFDDSSEEEEDDEEEEEEGKKEGEKRQKEGSGMMPDFLIDSETVHNIFMEI